VTVFPGFLLLVSFAATLSAQPQVPTQDTQSGQAQQATIPDGGVTQVLQSIYVPPILNAPFTAIVHTEWIRPLSDGGTFTLANQRQIARDSQGRIYEERWFLVPKDGKVQSRRYLIQIADPEARTLYNCFLLRTPHQCTLQKSAERPIASYRPAARQSGALPNGDGFRTHEELGTQDIQGIETQGTRDTITYNAGVIGNDRPFNVTREFWFATSLGIDLRSTVTNPSFGKQVFTLTDVSSSAPDPALFQIPEGFSVVDQRKPSPPTE